jgi:aryl-alcohol dehydrogenase-like predicted oxidoreductase
MQALHDVVQAGYVRYIGMSSCWAWQFQLMQSKFLLQAGLDDYADIHIAYALNNRLTPFISMQNQHNAIYREEEREMMPMLKHYGVGTIPWGPIAAGRMSFFFPHNHNESAIADIQSCVDHTKIWTLQPEEQVASKTAEANSHPIKP